MQENKKLFKKEDLAHIADLISNVDDISDGYHTFEELYDHRSLLFIFLCKTLTETKWNKYKCVFSMKHNDGTMYDNMFIINVTELITGLQISYHLEDKYLYIVKRSGIEEVEYAPEFDGHTPDDVLLRLTTFILQKEK